MRKLTPEQSVLLDAVRGLSAVAVLIGHALTMLPEPPAIGTTFPIQSYGVVLFFALSGFLIAYHCMQRSSVSFPDYMIDRFARIFTAFLPAIILVALVDPLFRRIGDANSVGTFLANIFMVHHTPFNRILDGLPRFNAFGSGRQFWTIAVEWWLYTLFGVFFYMRQARWSHRAMMLALAPVAMLVVGYFTVKETVAQVWIYSALAAIAFCMVSDASRTRGLAIGMVAFFMTALGYRLSIIWPAVAGGKVSVYDPSFMMLTVAALLSVLFLAADSRWFGKGLMVLAPFWKWLAGISYSLYLTHQTLQYLWQAKFGVGGYPSLVAMCSVCVIASVAFTWAFDRHHKRVAKALKSRMRRPGYGVKTSRSDSSADHEHRMGGVPRVN